MPTFPVPSPYDRQHREPAVYLRPETPRIRLCRACGYEPAGPATRCPMCRGERFEVIPPRRDLTRGE